MKHFTQSQPLSFGVKEKIEKILLERAKNHFEQATTMRMHNKLGLTDHPQNAIDSEHARGLEVMALLTEFDRFARGL